jgi:hypothetical protein
MSGEYIAWELGEPDRFRVVYFRVDETDDQVDQTVLIEAPIAVRVRAKPALPELLRAVGDAASLGQPDEANGGNEVDAPEDGASPSGPPSDDDIPF